jgi:hypothetical protein
MDSVGQGDGGTELISFDVPFNVGDPDQDHHVFGPPGSGSISQRYGSGSGSGSFPYLIMVLSGLK